MEATEQRAVYVGPREGLADETAVVETREDGIYACFDDVRTGMNIGWFGPFQADEFSFAPIDIAQAARENPSFTA